MSATATATDRETRGRDRELLVRRVVLALTVVALVAGSFLVASAKTGPGAQLRDAEALIQRLHDQGDAQAVADRIVAGSLGEEVTDEQVVQALQSVLAQPAEIIESELVDVRGIPVARIRTAQLEWCVTPGEQLLVGCRVGTAEAAATVRGAPVEVAFAAVDVFADRVDLAVVLTTQEPEPVPLGTDVGLDQPPGVDMERVETSYTLGGQRMPLEEEQIAVRNDAGLLLVFEDGDVDDVEAAVGGPYALTWDGGTVELEVTEATWFIE